MTIDWDNVPSNTSFLEKETDPENAELTENEKATDQLRKVLEQAYTKDKLSKQVKFNAVCLRKLKDESDKAGVVKVKARIPELHSLIPKPKSEKDYATMSLYPTFIALKTSFKDGVGQSAEDIPPGTILVVTFGNMSNFSQPRILEIGNIAASSVRGTSGSGGSSGTGRGRKSFPWGFIDGTGKEVPHSEKSGIEKFGAWSFSAAFTKKAYRDRMLKIAKNLKLDYVSFFVNDEADKSFRIIPSQKQMNETVKAFTDIGVEVGIVTWIQPNDEFIDGIINKLTPMAIKAGARKLELDAEGPWISESGLTDEQIKTKDLEFATKWSKKKFSIGLSVTAIVSTKIDLITRMIEVADEVTPQLYVTNSYETYVGGYPNPYEKLIRLTKAKYKDYVGTKKLTVGLAGYDQDDIEEFLPQDAVDASLMMAKKMGTKEVRYWLLPALTGDVAGAIKVWRK